MKANLDKHEFTVKKIKRETSDVSTFYLSSGRKLDFIAGQYVAVYLNKDGDDHGKFYTISSAPGDDLQALSVKKMGHFSSALHDLKIGDPVYLSGPYGYFYPSSEMTHVVFLAAGIGVTPFLSILKDCKNKKDGRKIDLYYVNRNSTDTAFSDELSGLKNNINCNIYHFITRDGLEAKPDHVCGHIKISDIKKRTGPLGNKDFFICGPIGFVSDLRKMLLSVGVKEENIFTEAFFQ